MSELRLTSLARALRDVIAAELHNAGPWTIEERAESFERELRQLIRDEMAASKVLAIRTND